MNNQTFPRPRRSTLENQAERLGLELRRASGPNEVWSEGGDQPGPNRWALVYRQQGGLTSFVKGLGTLEDVGFYLDWRELNDAF